ncbi:uncharacterized protein [Epargyreus clarus]|uniref:uncharacterized protein n=1 Tax=Epargyreus clarus TaxID=520877 RepID=UPI003C2D2064
MSRCIRYYGAGNMPTTKNFMDNQNFQSYETSLNENEEEDDQICDSCCTVSTQSTVGPTGELVIGDYSHVLYSTLGEAIVRDIEGTELKILSYKSADDSFEHKSHNLCSFDKIFGIRKLINLKELKNQISLLKQHIYTSIFEIQEKCSLAGTISTRQYEEGHENNEDSSEDITIPTPYMGVVLKAKKKPQECPAGNQPPHVSPINDETVRETLPEQLIPRTSEINNVSIVPNIINAKKEVTEEPASQQKIEVTTSGVEIENQKRTFSEECCISILDSPVNTICDLNHNETNECASPMPIKSFSICEETVNESLSAKKCLDSFKEIGGITKYQKQSNDEITESGDSRKKSNKIPEIETHTKQTNHFFKKRVYGISIDQFQNMNNKKFIKCVSNKSCVFIYRNNEKANQKGLQAEGNKSIQRIRERKSEENCRENDSEIKSPPKIFSVEGAKIKAQLIHSKLLNYFKMKSNQNINIPITGTQDNCHKLSDNSSSSIKKGIKIVESDNTNIVKPSLQQIEICNIENKSKKSQHFTLTNSGLKIDPNPKYNSNKSTTLLKGNESVQQSIHKDNVEQQENCFTDSKMKVEVTLGVENTVKSEVSKKAHLLTKKVSNLSSVLKRILRGKMHKSVKSLPEPTVHRSFRESCQTQINVGEIERKTYINNSKKRGGEPKTSEREMFSIQYSAISEIKCSSKFLKIGKEQSYAEEQEVHGIRGPVPEGIRRLTA